MFRKIGGSFLLALANIRSHFFHTILSVLGIVIGVASLVAILSLIDGMEKFAKDQIATTTSLNAIVVRTEAYKSVNNIRLRKDTFSTFRYENVKEIKSALTKPAQLYLRSYSSGEAQLAGIKIGTGAFSVSDMHVTEGDVEFGERISEGEIDRAVPVAVVNKAFAKAMNIANEKIVGQEIAFNGRKYKVSGVLAKEAGKDPRIVFPITLLSSMELRASLPELVIEAESVVDVNPIKEELSNWLKEKFGTGESDFSITTNEARVKQAERGFLLFRIIMGLIVGISVLVGGIGVMNVLLISVNERTKEIGIRKAVGANRRDIVFLFLAESVTVSSFGSILGLILGILGTMTVVPIVKALTEIPFQALYTLNTLLVISIVAVVVGIVFGTYPAIRASRLDPIEAIRRE